jgi:hypothetical protein
MTTETIHLTIPAPCQQPWQDMKAEETGRFCAGCQKTVTDFSSLTNQQAVSAKRWFGLWSFSGKPTQ